jgi:predicted enzyme related to lactoylglutathione lyase
MAAAHRLDGHVEVDQVVYVPPYGSPVDAEPVSELSYRPDAAGLQELQQREHPASRSSHRARLAKYRTVSVRYLSYRAIEPASQTREITMDFVSIRIITSDVARLVDFYERATGVQASRSNDDFAELRTTCATLAIGSTRTVPLFAPGAARPADNRTVIIEFLVDDVDGVHENLAGFVQDVVKEPTTMPWGNRSLLIRDPDGNLVNFFTPVTPAAIEKFAR